MFEIILTERARKHWDRLKADTGLEKRKKGGQLPIYFFPPYSRLLTFDLLPPAPQQNAKIQDPQ